MKTKIFLLIFAISVIAFSLCSFTPVEYSGEPLEGEYYFGSSILFSGLDSLSYAAQYSGESPYYKFYPSEIFTRLVYNSSQGSLVAQPNSRVIIDDFDLVSNSLYQFIVFPSATSFNEPMQYFLWLNSQSSQNEGYVWLSDELDFSLSYGFNILADTSIHEVKVLVSASTPSLDNITSIVFKSDGVYYGTGLTAYNNYVEHRAYISGEWVDQEYRKLTITNTALPNWVLAFFGNNTFVSRVISGMRYFNLNPDVAALKSGSTGLEFYTTDLVPEGSLCYFSNGYTNYFGLGGYPSSDNQYYNELKVYDVATGWVSNSYRTIDFGSGFDFGNNSFLYNWILNNTVEGGNNPEYDEGYDEGYDNGYNSGYDDAITDNVFGDFFVNMFTTPVLIMNGIVLLEYDGVVITIWSVMCTLFVVMVTLWLLKLLAGG